MDDDTSTLLLSFPRGADDPMFIKFLDTVKAKGFFANLTQGTPEYEERYAKVVEKYKARAPAATKDGAPSAAAAAPVANDEVAAEKFKNEGNKLLQENKCEKAIECYTKAIEAAPTGKNTHIYYANRLVFIIVPSLALPPCHRRVPDVICITVHVSATSGGNDRILIHHGLAPNCVPSTRHCRSAAKLQKKLKDTDGAESDARKCVSMEPGYSKGYNRLGAALESSGNFQEAMSAYERCLDADADNSVAKEALQRLKKSGSSASSSSSSKAVSSNGRPSTASAGAGAAPGGFPGMPGGLGGLAGLMQDPSMQAMAANLMKDPSALAGLMSNPMVQQMMSGMGGAGGMGGLASMFGGAGAGGGPKFNAPAAAVDDDEEMPPLETEEEAAAGGAGTGGGAPAGFPAGFNPANMPPGMASLMSDPEVRRKYSGSVALGRDRRASPSAGSCES